MLIFAVNERLRLLAALSTVDYAAKHQKVQRARYNGTGGWLLENKAYRKWKDDNTSACLRCSGIRKDFNPFTIQRHLYNTDIIMILAGCGKTFMTYAIYHHTVYLPFLPTL